MQTITSSKYRRIAEELKGQIKTGKISVGQTLPSHHELIANYDVAMGTVRQAINQLISEGWVRAEKGRGIFVQQPGNRIHEPSKTKEQTIGFAVLGNFPVGDPFNQMLLEGAASVLQGAGMKVTYGIFPIENGQKSIDGFIDFIQGLSGLLAVQDVTPEILKIIKDHQVKTVMIGVPYHQDPAYNELNMIYADSKVAGYLAGQTFAIHGHKKVCFVYRRDTEYFLQALKSFEQACQAYGIENCHTFLVPDREKEIEVARKISDLKDVTGVMVMVDSQACRLIQDLSRHEILVPRDKSVIAIGGLPRNILSEANLTRINIGYDLFGPEAAKLILSDMTSKSIHKTVPVKFENGKTLASL